MSSIVVQVGTVGESPRRRAKGNTVAVCADCARWLLTKKGRDVRAAIMKGIKAQLTQLYGAGK